MTDDYHESLSYLYGRLDYERIGMPRSVGDLRIGRMRRILRALGDPQTAFPIVHVAGTKGKGSTSAMIAAVSQAHGLRTGLFTSPHLHRVEERFLIDGLEVTTTQFITLVNEVRTIVETLDHSDPHFSDGGATFFEITTAMGLIHFARSNAQLVVLEVGMGGRLDSTNAVRPLISVLTTISFDHTRLLGSTLGAIASEKAGIIKHGRTVVSGVRGSESRAVIRRIAGQRRAPLREIDVDFSYRYVAPQHPLNRPEAGRVEVETWRASWGPLDLPLFGEHQAHNAAIALATVDTLRDKGFQIDNEEVVQGFANMNWPARTEVLGEHPWLVIDGAHNPASATALAETLRTCFPDGDRTLIFGSTREKDFRSQLQALLPNFAKVIFTRYKNNPRALPPEEASEATVDLGYPAPLLIEDLGEALHVAKQITPDDGLICVTGSLFLAAEIREHILGL